MSNEEHSLLQVMFKAFDQLRKLGWQEVLYAPYDKELELIEAGSTGVHRGCRTEDGFVVYDKTDSWPSNPILFRLVPDA